MCASVSPPFFLGQSFFRELPRKEPEKARSVHWASPRTGPPGLVPSVSQPGCFLGNAGPATLGSPRLLASWDGFKERHGVSSCVWRWSSGVSDGTACKTWLFRLSALRG